MPTKILMPALSPTMTEGNLVSWLKKEGDTVESGDIIAEIETDKATMEVEAVDEGTLAKIFVPEGTEDVKVNTLIAVLLEEGEESSALDGFGGGNGGGDRGNSSEDGDGNGNGDSNGDGRATTTAQNSPDTKSSSAVGPSPHNNVNTLPHDKGGKASTTTSSTSSTSSSQGRLFASPLAKRIASQEGLDLSCVAGTGPRGRIVKSDVEKAITLSQSQAGASSGGTSMTAASVGSLSARPDDGLFPAYQDKKMSNMRKVIAKRLTEAKQEVPHFYLSVDCELDTLLKARKQLNETLPDDQRLSVNDFVIKAVAQALKTVPAANASYINGVMRQYETADVSVAVAVEGGLVTPIVRDADHKSLGAISSEMKGLIKKARDGKLRPEEFQGGTFSISNLGMFGVKHFSAVINPPQGCILAVGAGEKRPVVKGDSLTVATVMTCTLSVDHRVVDGAVGAEFLKHFKQNIENPVLMIL